jgi:hypothetical protein
MQDLIAELTGGRLNIRVAAIIRIRTIFWCQNGRMVRCH